MSDLHAYVFIAILIVAAIHVGLFLVHTSFWTTLCPKLYDELDFVEAYQDFAPKNAPSYFILTDTLGFNQGVYNLFLAAGLLWAAYAAPGLALQLYIASFFLILVIIAGLVGGITLKAWLFWVQVVPAAITLGAIYHYHPDFWAMIANLYDLLEENSISDLARAAQNVER